jgi:hypothetical protein
MPWYRKRFQSQPLGVRAAQSEFETLFLAGGGPPEMLMISERHDSGDVTVWVRVSPQWAGTFQGFAPAPDSELPEVATFLAGYPDQFEALFQYDNGR